MEEELARVKYENNVLVSTEALLESKCAALDSKLEEALAVVKRKSKELDALRKQRSEDQAREVKLEDQTTKLQEQVARLQGQVSKLQTEIASLETGESKTIRDLEQSLHLQLCATAQACKANDGLHSKVLEIENRAKHAESTLKHLEQTIEDKNLYIANLESMLESLQASQLETVRTKEQERAKEREAVTRSLEGHNKELEDALKEEKRRGREEKARLEAIIEQYKGREKALLIKLTGQDREKESLRMALSEVEQATQEERLASTRLHETIQHLHQTSEEKEREKRVAIEAAKTERAKLDRQLRDTQTKLRQVEALLAEQRDENSRLERSLLDLKQSFSRALERSRERLGHMETDNKVLRTSLVECQGMIFDSLHRLVDPQSARTREEDGGKLHVGMLEDEASHVLNKSSESLYFRKLRLSQLSSSSSSSTSFNSQQRSRRRGLTPK